MELSEKIEWYCIEVKNKETPSRSIYVGKAYKKRFISIRLIFMFILLTLILTSLYGSLSKVNVPLDVEHWFKIQLIQTKILRSLRLISRF